MNAFSGEVELNLEQATAVAQAMWHIAEADQGVHEREREMIQGFYQSCAAESGVEGAVFNPSSFDVEKAREVLNTPELKQMLVHSCLLLGFADGHCSQVERAAIEQLALGIGMSSSELVAIDREVKRSLLAQFEGVEVFRSATYQIGEQLGMTSEEVDEVLTRR